MRAFNFAMFACILTFLFGMSFIAYSALVLGGRRKQGLVQRVFNIIHPLVGLGRALPGNLIPFKIRNKREDWAQVINIRVYSHLLNKVGLDFFIHRGSVEQTNTVQQAPGLYRSASKLATVVTYHQPVQQF